MSRLECFFDRRAAASCIAIIAILVIVCLAGCGGGGGGSSNPVSVNINFTSVTVPTSGAEQFSATVSGTTNTGLTRYSNTEQFDKYDLRLHQYHAIIMSE